MEDNRVSQLPSPPTNPSSIIQRVPMARKGLGTKGQKIQLLTNHFKVSIAKTEGHFHHYSIAFSYGDGHPVDEKGIGWKIIDKVRATYAAELAGKTFAYDGEKSLFTLGSLPEKKLNFTIVLDDSASLRVADNGISARDEKRSKQPYGSKIINVKISFAAMIPLQSIAAVLRGQESDCFQDAMRVLDVILRQNAARRGCLLVRQSFFQNNPKNFTEVGGGVLGCRGFNSSFQATQGGLTLNMDVSTTMIVKPGPVINFLLMNQNVKDLHEIDWRKAKRALKSLRIIVETTKKEYKITGLSDYPCKDQLFSMKQKSGNGGNGEAATLEISVYEYFVNYHGIPLRNSADFPCINIGKPKRPTYFPIELCSLIPLQRYTRALSSQQRASLVEKSRQKPKERMRVLKEGLTDINYNGDPILGMAGISISSQFTQVEGRILPPPKLKVGNGVDFLPHNGRWNFNNKTLGIPTKIQRWSVVNFSARCDIRSIINNLMKCAKMKGIAIEQPAAVVEEEPSYRRAPPQVRVQKMLERLRERYGDKAPNFLLCILPERKISEIYGPWQLNVLVQCGIFTQCIAPTKVNDQYLTNVVLNINAKLGGLNSMLAIEHSPSMSIVSKQPTMILGMDVNHGSVGRDAPSIAAVVGSRQWPLISRYRASVRTQPPKVEMIASLFKPYREPTDGKIKDGGIMRELLLEFYTSSSKRKPEQIIIFRDGVSESQFNQVLNIELDQIIEACKFLDENWNPKFVVIIAQKRHHTRFFQANSPDNNVPPGTIIDNHVGHPRGNDFYMVPHAGIMGTSRPTHYHPLYDEVGFTTDEMQELVHSLSYVYQRGTSAVSLVAPVQYAHLAAAKMSKIVNFDEMSDTSSSTTTVPELPRLHENVRNSMFFC